MSTTQTQIATDMVTSVTTNTNEVTNFNVGSGIRSLIDAYSTQAAIIQKKYQDQIALAVINGLYQLLGVEPDGAVGSTYQLQITLASSATSSVTLATGTAIIIPNSSLQWKIGQSITLTHGTTQTVSATCTTTGTITNVPANTITQLVVPVTNVTVTNPSAQPTVLGRDAPTQIELQAMLSNAINELHKGDQSAVEYGVLTSNITDASGDITEQVVKSKEVDSNTKGLAYCYVYNGIGDMSSTLLTQTQNVINGYVDIDGTKHIGYKAAGVTMTVVDAYRNVVNISVLVLPKYSYTLLTIQSNVQSAIQSYFDNLDIGQGVSLAQLLFVILNVQGVADAQITSPSTSLASVPYVANPATELTLTATGSGTSLAAGTYTVGCTFTNVWGETQLSPTATVTLTAGQEIQVGAITLPLGATGVNYYLSQVGGNTVTLDTSGTGAQINLTASPSSGAASPPISNAAEIQGNIYIPGTITISQMTVS